MKPTEADIKWCLDNRELVMCWLVQRGGWQEGDWYTYGVGDKVYLVEHYELKTLIEHPDKATKEGVLWLPSVGDVLELLRAKQIRTWLKIGRDGKWTADAFTDVVPYPLGEYKPRREESPLIALMELGKTVDTNRE